MFLFSGSLTRGREDAGSGAVFAKYARYLCVTFLFASFLFLACEEPKDDPSLDGTWVSEYGEVYVIDLKNNIFNCPSTDFPEYAYKGNVSEVVYFDKNDTAGIIYVELTETGSGFSKSGTGNFTGIHFVNLTDTTVEISAAADAISYATPVKATLAEAKQLLNVDSVQTYFSMTSACERQ